MPGTFAKGTVETFRLLVDRSLEHLVNLDKSMVSLRTPDRIVSLSASSIGWDSEIEPDPAAAASQCWLMLNGQSDFAELKKDIEADPLIASHLGNTVGTELQTEHISLEKVLNRFLLDYFKSEQGRAALAHVVFDKNRSAVPEEAALSKIVSQYERAFDSDRVSVEFFTILEGFRMEPLQVQLESNLLLEGLDTKAVVALWNSDKGVRESFPLWGFYNKSPQQIHGRLKVHIETQKLVFSTGSQPEPTPKSVEIEAINSLALATDALRLLKPGAVSMGPIFARSNSPFLCPRTFFLPWVGSSPYGEPYSLDTADFEPLTSVVSAIRSARQTSKKQQKALLLAVDRISRSSVRIRKEDALLDVMIALEALVLSGAGDPTIRGELRFRLSLYVARFLARNRGERERLYKLVRKAYDLRSKVVHGDTLDEQEKATVIEVVNVARQVALALLKRTSANEPPINWDSLTLQ